jgi:putative ABC transport system permease protein
VVGVVAQDAGPGDVVAPMRLVVAAEGFGTASSSAVSQSQPWDGPSYGSGIVSAGGDPYAAIFVEATSLDEVTALRARIGALGYETSASETLIENVQRYSHVIEIVLSAIGIIALLIAGIGIADALFAAVRERRREIGVLKAIGARDGDVRQLFLVEAGLTGFAGGVVGSTVGWAMARATGEVVNRYLANQGLPPVAMGFPVAIVAITVVGSSVLALIAGAIPATRAARLPAVEAMGEV